MKLLAVITKQGKKAGSVKTKYKIINTMKPKAFQAPAGTKTEIQDIGFFSRIRSLKSRVHNDIKVSGDGDVYMRNLDVNVKSSTKGEVNLSRVATVDVDGAKKVHINKAYAAMVKGAQGDVSVNGIETSAKVTGAKGNVHMRKIDVAIASDNHGDVHVSGSRVAQVHHNHGENNIATGNINAEVTNNKGYGLAYDNVNTEVEGNKKNFTDIKAFVKEILRGGK